ncbi:hypothetical protein HYDPIDRAFT_24554 [Hydnomerulius pinastri MD-312]|nr:hypothetical protein HYDPIDRAFT_24554 [Hydnomerulius pinastri MD-312]
MAAPSEPPYYLLISHNSLQHNSSGQTSSALAHADIEYRYADDSPLSLLPRHPDEHVLVLNHDPANITRPTIKSTSSQLAVSGIKVLAAPGAGADEEDANRNDNMYVLEVTSVSDDHTSVESSQTYLQNPQAIVARFKQRNAALRRILEHPGTPVGDRPPSRPNSQPKSPGWSS